MNNGIQLSVNYPNRVYVADTIDKSINMYKFDKELMTFTLINALHMEDSPDNIHVDPVTKQYYIATISKINEFIHL